jgi:glycosyltransferase involved in cell wall biosynthesis
MDVGRASWRLSIAVVYSRMPLPMRRADQMTVAHLLSFLKERGHAVDLFCICAGGVASEHEMEWLRSACESIYIYEHGWKAVYRALWGVASRQIPFQVGLFSNPAKRRDLERKIEDGTYDIVYTYYFRSAEVTRGLGARQLSSARTAPPNFLAFQLSQTLNTRRIAKNSPNLANKLFYEIESRLVARYEARIWKEFSRSIFIGKSDLDTVQSTCREHGLPIVDNYTFGAHGTDVKRFAPRHDIAERANHLVFSGVMRTPTNVQSVMWFAQNVWPLIREKVPEASLSIVGREPSAEVLALSKLPGVTVTGTVPDTSVAIAEAEICINPMQAGGGMQNKLLEYLASEKAVVATSVANEGIGAEPGRHLMIADDAAEFARSVLELLGDPEKRRRLARSARNFVLDHWTWEAHFMELEQNFYKSLSERDADQAKALCDGVTVTRPAADSTRVRPSRPEE